MNTTLEKGSLPDVSRLTFDEKKHAYTLDGKLLQGVTSIIDGTSSKANLIDWAANMAVDYVRDNSIPTELGRVVQPDTLELARKAHTRRKESAGQKGTDAHALVEEYIKWCLTDPTSKFSPNSVKDFEAIRPFIQWAQENDVRFIAAEQRLYSETHKFAGTCDFVYLDKDGKLTIGDLKTFPKMWSADPFIQMGAYSLAWAELTGERPEQSVVVKMCDPEDERLRKYGGKAFAAYPRYALEEDEEMFLLRLKMYRYNENFVSPKE